MTKHVYKILAADEWEAAKARGVFTGSGIDTTDGYIHLSTAEQVRETATKWFAGRQNLVLVAFDGDDFGATLKWEPARDGALFPHVYGVIDTSLAKTVVALPAAPRGGFSFPCHIP